jgi:hypothetical protein
VIYSLPITILIEGLVCLAYCIWSKKPVLSILITSVIANLITQSLLWIGLNIFFQYYLLTLLIAEILIWLIEGFIFYSFSQLTMSRLKNVSLSDSEGSLRQQVRDSHLHWRAAQVSVAESAPSERHNIFEKSSIRESLFLSLLINLFSFGIGLFLPI